MTRATGNPMGRPPVHADARKGGVTPEYKAWRNIKQRCYLPTNASFASYGARGIRVCPRWLGSYEAFLADMGRRPSPTHSLDRIDPNGDYEPDNCRWATGHEQARNKRNNLRITASGLTKTLVEWSELSGIGPRTIALRLRLGWSPERAVSQRPGSAASAAENNEAKRIA